MEMELYMIKAWYDHREKPKNKALPIRYIDIGDKLPSTDKNVWVIPGHYRSQNEKFIRQVGIRFLNPQDVEAVWITSPDQQSIRRFVYEQGVWFEPTLYTTEKYKGYFKFDESVVLTGITNAGTAELTYLRNGNIYHLATIHFIPSSLSMEDYEDMIADLYQLREDFVRDDRNVAKVAINKMEVAQELEKNLQKLTTAVQQIDANPHAVLQLKTKLKKTSDTGRFDLRMELEQHMNPGKPNYRSRTLEPVVATYENKLIKQMLEDLVRYSTAMGSEKPTTKSRVRNLINERNMYFRKSDLEIQRLFSSVEKLESSTRYQVVHNKFSQEVEKIIEEERNVKNQTLLTANFNPNPAQPSGTQFIKLTFVMNGIFDEEHGYFHHQSRQGMFAQLSYDQRKPQLTSFEYSLDTFYGPVKNRPNSCFGTILLTGNHMLSHAKFYRAFCQDAQIDSKRKKRNVQISGFVQPQPYGIDAVTTPGKGEHNNYKFEFVQITNIHIDGKELQFDNQSLVEFAKNELPVMTHQAEQSENIFMRLKQLEKLKALTDEIKEAENIGFKYDSLKETAEKLLKLPLFSTIEIREQLPGTPTQLFLHNPVYRVAWQVIKQINQRLSASLYVKQHERQVSTGKVQYIFEVWSFYKMVHLLTKEMKWKLEDPRGLTSYLDAYLLNKMNDGPEKAVVLHWRDWQLEMYYEPRIDLTNHNYRTPDYMFIFKKNNTQRGMVILDAKYRNYVAQGENEWKKDIIDVAIGKYAQMHPVDEKWKIPLIVSGILHSDVTFSEEAEDQYNPYHVMYNEELFNTTLQVEKPHKYSSISMTPSNTYVFKNWFRLIMEFHLNEYKVCWNCGETNVDERQLLTRYGHTKYHYICTACNDFWVKIHCQKNRHHKIIKHTNNYHLQIKNRNKWWVICPYCGDGR